MGADIGMLSSGSIRSDLPPGSVTAEALIDVFPFTDKIAVVELNGEDLALMFEHSLSLAYGLAQISGVEIVYDSRKPSGERLIRLSVGGRPVDEDAVYRLATGAYQATGGDDFSILARNPSTISNIGVGAALVDYFRDTGTIVGRRVAESVCFSSSSPHQPAQPPDYSCPVGHMISNVTHASPAIQR
jgi:2',3'-cyclic-nucleotide 2'-phosphodiesterase (5'-nucleotidase family)